MIVIPDRTPEWYAARAGRWTASRAGDLMNANKPKKGEALGKPGQKCIDYLAEVAHERISGRPHEMGFESFAMREGRRLEPEIWENYEFRNGIITQPGGCALFHDRDSEFADIVTASPDRIIGEDGIGEGKAHPESAPRSIGSLIYRAGDDFEDLDFCDVLNNLATKSDAVNYDCQVQWQLWVTARRWCDLCSLDTLLPPHLQQRQVRIFPDLEMHRQFEERVRWAEKQVARIIQIIKENAS